MTTHDELSCQAIEDRNRRSGDSLSILTTVPTPKACSVRQSASSRRTRTRSFAAPADASSPAARIAFQDVGLKHRCLFLRMSTEPDFWKDANDMAQNGCALRLNSAIQGQIGVTPPVLHACGPLVVVTEIA